MASPHPTTKNTTKDLSLKQVNRVTAVHSGRETPGPIPNPEAKPASADDTTHTGGKVGHRRTQIKVLCPPILLGGTGICAFPTIQSNNVGIVGEFFRSIPSSNFFLSNPPPYPVKLPLAPITRWHGTMMPIGL